MLLPNELVPQSKYAGAEGNFAMILYRQASIWRLTFAMCLLSRTVQGDFFVFQLMLMTSIIIIIVKNDIISYHFSEVRPIVLVVYTKFVLVFEDIRCL